MSLHDHQRIEQRLASVADPVRFLIRLFAHAPVGFAVWNADGTPLLTNSAFMDIFLVEPPPEYNVLQDELLAANGMLAFFVPAVAHELVVAERVVEPERVTDFVADRVALGRGRPGSPAGSRM